MRCIKNKYGLESAHVQMGLPHSARVLLVSELEADLRPRCPLFFHWLAPQLPQRSTRCNEPS